MFIYVFPFAISSELLDLFTAFTLAFEQGQKDFISTSNISLSLCTLFVLSLSLRGKKEER